MVAKLKRRWTQFEEDTLRQMYSQTHPSELAKSLNRSKHAVLDRAFSLGLHTTVNYSRPWKIKSFEPSAVLSYLIGAIKGDGSVYISKKEKVYKYEITLSAKDYEFVDTVSKALITITGKKASICKINQTLNNKMNYIFKTQVHDKSLAYFLTQPFESLKKYIEPYPSQFLRGFFDAEGAAMSQVLNRKNKEGFSKKHSLAVIRIYNTDKQLIDFCRYLLIKLKIYPSPKTYITKGNLCENPKDCYVLQVAKKKSVKRFMSAIGTSIPRKRLNV